MYTNGVPCMGCGRAVIQAGIIEVIFDKAWSDENLKKWNEHSKRTLEVFLETGVKVKEWGGELINIVKFRKGKLID